MSQRGKVQRSEFNFQDPHGRERKRGGREGGKEERREKETCVFIQNPIILLC